MLCAPSLGGESFGMVLTEAFAAGTPVVASDIAGYRDVVRDGVDGVLVPRGDAQALAEALRDLYDEPERRAAMARAAALGASGSPGRASPPQVMEAYEDAIADAGARDRAASAPRSAIGARAADLKPRVPAQRLASLEPPPTGPQAQQGARRSRAASAWPPCRSAAPCSRSSRFRRSGLTNIAMALITSSPTLVLLGLAIMCSAMVMRAFSWHAILKAALPRARVRLADAAAGNLHRRADVLDPAGTPRRALARARGRPTNRAPAREPADRARHGRLADAAEHRRADRPRRDHVLVGRPVQRPPERAAGRGDRAGRAAGGRAARADRAARRRESLASARGCTRSRRRAATR